MPREAEEGSSRALAANAPPANGTASNATAIGPAPASLDDLAFAAFGPAGRKFCAVAMVLSLAGLCAGYLIFVGRTLRNAFGNPAWATYALSTGGGTHGSGGLECNLFTVMATLIVMPLTLVRDYNRVKWSGVLGNVSLVAALCVVCYHIVDHIVHTTRLDQGVRRLLAESAGEDFLLAGFAGRAAAPTALAPSPSSSSSSSSFFPTSPHPSPAPEIVVKNLNLDALPVFLGLVFFAFAFHGVILGVDSVTAEPKRFTRNLDIGAVLGVGTYVLFGCLGYYAYGQGTAQIIFASVVPATLDLRVVEVLFCLSMVLLYPLQILPVIQIFERWFGVVNPELPPRTGIGTKRRIGTAFSPMQTPQIPRNGGDGRGAVGDATAARGGEARSVQQRRSQQQYQPPQPWASDTAGGQTTRGGGDALARAGSRVRCQQNAVRIGLTLLTGVLAVVFGEVFSQILSIVGALGFSLLSFVLPPMIYLKIMRGELPLWDRALSTCILAVGIAGMGISAVIDGESIVKYFEGDSTDPCGGV
jgi:amino acid permease